jgi:hypothetical protein
MIKKYDKKVVINCMNNKNYYKKTVIAKKIIKNKKYK